jgi:hypothetical protein
MTSVSSVFLSYNRRDQPAVQHVATALKARGISVWFDEWELQPGVPWIPVLQEQLVHSEAIAICVGPSGFGRWQQPELETALEQQIRRGCRVIPVILPGATLPADDALPPFLARSTWVMFHGGLDDDEALSRICWGITGQNPYKREPSATPVDVREENADASDDALTNLAESLKSGNVTYFLGSAPWTEDAVSGAAPDAIARVLLLKLKLIGEDYCGLLPPVDIASAYYAIQSGESNLEGRIAELVAAEPGRIPLTHQALASLLQRLAQRPPRRIRGGTRPQLVVVTNVDTMAERALLQEGIAFTRVVQHRSLERLHINEYKDVSLLADNYTLTAPAGGGAQRVNLHNFDDLDNFIANHNARTIELAPRESAIDAPNPLHTLPLQEFTSPILYKFRGSLDIPDSCILSTDQYFAFLRRVSRQHLIPAQISEILANSPLLFLGYGFPDPDFRLTYHVLLQKAVEIRSYEKFGLAEVPTELRNNLNFWRRFKQSRMRETGIVMLDVRPDVFLRQLAARL